MVIWGRLSFSARAALISVCVVCMGAYVVLGMQALRWFAAATQELESAAPRYARLAGLLQSADSMREAAIESRQGLAELVYPASADMASISALVQQDMRGLLDTAGLSVSGSRVLELIEHEGFVQIPVEFTASGPMDGFARALLALRTGRPLVLLDGIDIKPVRSRRNQAGGQTQTVELSLRLSVVKLS